MVYISPLSIRSPTARTPLHLQMSGASSAWSEISMGNWRNTMEFGTPPPAYREIPAQTLNRTYRNNLQSLYKPVCLTILITICFWWLFGQQRDQFHFSHYDIELSVKQPSLDGLQFISAGHPYIRDKKRRIIPRYIDVVAVNKPSFTNLPWQGIYLDVAFNGSSTFFLSLHNSIQETHGAELYSKNISADAIIPPQLDNSSAEPISLLAQVDDEEYVVLPNATSLVTIRTKDLDPHSTHIIRIIAPMIGQDTIETFQFLGLWIDAEGQLIPVRNPNPTQESKAEYEHSANEGIYRMNGVQRDGNPQRKMLEILTDMPGSMTGRNRRKYHMDSGIASGILGGVMGWEYLIGEMFGSDHVSIGMDGMCLMQDCIDGRGSPAGLADVDPVITDDGISLKLHSGPLGTEQYGQPWLFQAYTPQVIILNVGNADWESFQTHNEEYNLTKWELSLLFEESYVSLIRAIRTLAYPKYPLTPAESLQYDRAPHDMADIPIFVIRPFRGQLEQATHSVVDRLRFEGDKSVFWLDTSGWLNTFIDFERQPEDQDFFLDEESPAKEWRLTERGNQRVAILLHLHVCQYLALDTEKCAFLAPEVYEGKAVDPDAMRFEEYMRDEKERRLKKIF
ncbi:hypothetical protein ACMFMG_007165 [Clarireedia jacksonii]